MNDHIITRRMQSEKITVKCSTMTLEVNVMAEGLLSLHCADGLQGTGSLAHKAFQYWLVDGEDWKSV